MNEAVPVHAAAAVLPPLAAAAVLPAGRGCKARGNLVHCSLSSIDRPLLVAFVVLATPPSLALTALTALTTLTAPASRSFQSIQAGTVAPAARAREDHPVIWAYVQMAQMPTQEDWI